MDWLEQYTSVLLMNLLGTQLRKYFGKYLQCLKIIRTSWTLNRSVGRICRMGAFYYYIYEQLFIASSDKYEKVKNSLTLYYDEKGILRLNARISNVENFNFGKKFPILLRNDSHFTQLVIRLFFN